MAVQVKERSKNNVVTKHPGGRKSYWDLKIKDRLTEIEAWARDGYLEKHIAKMLGVSETTFFKYKCEKPELSRALKVNKEIADILIENALRDRALGYEYEEKTSEKFIGADGEISRSVEKTIIKKVLPDVTAQIFWLKNRQPEKWRDKRQTQLTGIDDGPIKVSSENEIKREMEPNEAALKYARMLEEV